ncbi:hypothetical protein [Streptomyces halobius]|uniref:XRE family transcriptional regulator n=1 Tax=Streptomyces halobius TaxID=2879846 RepID=A0ABY4MK64_9ACTN|nr:hypothetical protein [Streptomyces halobius]UQA96721.1 hypothetical protein K9S39_36960 [Streptomyces halobius]
MSSLGAEMSAGENDEPRTLQEKINYLLKESFPDGTPSDREFCRIVEARGGALSHSYFGKLRKGQLTEVRDETLQALGMGFDCDWRFFKPESQVEAEVSAGLRFLADKRAGGISGIAGRGITEEGLSPDLLNFALDLLEKARQETQEPPAEPRT